MAENLSSTQQPNTTRSMSALSRSFYEIAHEFTQAMSMGKKPQLIKYPSAVVILSVSSLESYIKEFLSFRRQLDFQRLEPEIAKLDRRKLVDKWSLAPRIFAETSFETAAEPFQSFCHLVSLRNALTHYDPRFRTPCEFPSRKIENLKTKFSFTFEGTAEWTSQVLNLECSKWSCRTVKSMIRKFHEFVGGIDESSGPYPWPDVPV